MLEISWLALVCDRLVGLLGVPTARPKLSIVATLTEDLEGPLEKRFFMGVKSFLGELRVGLAFCLGVWWGVLCMTGEAVGVVLGGPSSEMSEVSDSFRL